LVGEIDKPVHRLTVTGDVRLPFTTRARILADYATALNPKDERSFFKVKGAAHIGRAFELPADTVARSLQPKELKVALEKLTELDPTECRIRLADTYHSVLGATTSQCEDGGQICQPS
jgi:hypothetical protein